LFPQKNLSPEKLTQYKAEQVCTTSIPKPSNLQKKTLGTRKLDKIGVLVSFSIPKLKFYKITQLFIESVSLVRDFFEGTRENIFHIFHSLAS
jgi:hypothetical protein